MSAPEFIGHKRITDMLWRMVSEDRLPQSILLAGPEGVGKATLARHLAAGINCVNGPGKPCGDCSPCQNMLVADLSLKSFQKQLADRLELAPAKRAESPLVISTHPDFLVFPPDGPMHVINIEQARMLSNAAHYGPSVVRRRIFLLDHVDRAKVEAANALLKTIEEPADGITIILTTEHPFLLPATIRSRTIPFYFGPLEDEEMQYFLANRHEIPETSKDQIKFWAQGSPGVAVAMDCNKFQQSRKSMLTLITTALSQGEFAHLVKTMESIGRKQSDGIDRLAPMVASLLRDLLHLHVGIMQGLTHQDIDKELMELAPLISYQWFEKALVALEELEVLQLFNIQKQIALEAYALGLQQ